ncbi:MAG: ABC transporter substrate-binding protein [Chloroflexota bacterium]
MAGLVVLAAFTACAQPPAPAAKPAATQAPTAAAAKPAADAKPTAAAAKPEAAKPEAAKPAAAKPAASGGADNSRLVVVYNNTVNSVDPVNADFAQSNLVEQAFYDTLVAYDADNKIVGRLAASFKLASDATAVEITLRSGVKFHDGTPLTAKDVAYSLDRYTKLGKGVAQFIRGYAATTVTDDTHLTIKLDRPNSLFLGGLSKIYILNSTLLAKEGGTDDGQGWLSNHDAGSGPFTLTSIEQNGNITVSRFEDYWEYDAGRPKTLIYRLIKETATQRDELKAGNVDVTSSLGPLDIKQLEGANGVKILKNKDRSIEYVAFNMVSGETTNPAVRKAIQLAYDYNGAMAKIYGGDAEIANGPLPTTMACHPDLPKSGQDVELAKKTLADAGLKDLKLTMNFQTAFEYQKQEATLLQSNLKDIGITLDLTPLAFPDWLARLSDKAQIPQMFLLGDFAQFPDPGVMLVPYYMSTSIGSNRTGYANPEVDALLTKALGTGDAAEQCKLYEQAQTLIDKDAPILSMYTRFSSYGYRQNVSGFHIAYAGNGPWIPDLRVAP